MAGEPQGGAQVLMRDDSPKEEIRRRIDVIAYISRYVPLQRSGRRFRGRCPFHQERHPSFYVDPASGVWKCFGCGAGGDLFSFVQRVQNCTFVEAAEQLAMEAGVEWRPAARDQQGRSVRQAVYRANELALRFFVEQLAGPEGEAAREYLHTRGIDDSTAERFELGYAPPDGQSLQRYLASRGLTRDLIAKAGLVNAAGRDMFSERVIFAVRDVTGRVVGFGGRALHEDEPAKYINSPDTPVFRKGETLYALHLARAAAAEAGRLVIVEGYTDVIAAHKAGMEYVVACLGTALTADHLRLASRYTDEIVLAYDADTAGLKAALRDVGMFEACAAEVKIALLPEGHDPDTLVRAGGAKAFEEVLDGACSAVEFRLQQVLGELDGAEPTPALMAAAAQILSEVPDSARRAEFLDRVADWFGRGDAGRTSMVRRALLTEVGRRVRKTPRPGGTEAARPSRGQDDRDMIVQTVTQCSDGHSLGRMRLERLLLSWAVSRLDLAKRILGELGPECFCCGGHGRVARALAAQLSLGKLCPDELMEEVSDVPQAEEVVAELLLAEPDEPEEEELAASIQKLRMLETCGVAAVRWERLPEGELKGSENEPAAELERLRREVTERLDQGDIGPEDPLYQRYCQLVELVHGRGGMEFYEDRRSRAASVSKRTQGKTEPDQ